MPTRDEAIQAAGEVYGAILANPERRARMRRDLAEVEAREAARQKSADDQVSSVRPGP